MEFITKDGFNYILPLELAKTSGYIRDYLNATSNQTINLLIDNQLFKLLLPIFEKDLSVRPSNKYIKAWFIVDEKEGTRKLKS